MYYCQDGYTKGCSLYCSYDTEAECFAKVNGVCVDGHIRSKLQFKLMKEKLLQLAHNLFYSVERHVGERYHRDDEY